MRGLFNIEIKGTKEDAKVKLVQLEGKLDMISSPTITQRILPLVDEGIVYFIVDLDGLEYIDSAGIYSLLQCYTRIKEKKGYLKLIRLNRNISATLDSIGVTKILPTYKTLSDALKV